MSEIEDLKRRLTAVESRNTRVEADKAWEISLTRRLLVAGLTYGVVGIYLMMINNEQPWINAFVPAIGFIISTLIVSFAKTTWTKLNSK